MITVGASMSVKWKVKLNWLCTDGKTYGWIDGQIDRWEDKPTHQQMGTLL